MTWRRLSVLVSLLILAACDGGRPGATSGPPATGGTSTSGTARPPSPAASPGGTASPAAGDVLRAGIATPRTLDPALADDAGALQVITQVFTPLLVAEPSTLRPAPGAASGYSISPEQDVITLTLKPNVRFHNGRVVTADDVRYSFERILRSGGPAATSLESLAGARDFQLRRDIPNVAGIEVLDALTIRLRLGEPFAEFPAVLTNPALAPMPKEAVESTVSPFSVNPVGNGPFRLARQWDQRGPIELLAADETALEAGGVRSIVFEPFGDLSRGLLALRRNELDVLSVPPAILPALEKEKDDLHTTAFLGSYFFAFNLRDTNLAKPEFRKAIVAAIDRPALVRDVLRGSLSVRNGVVPAAFPGWPSDACGDVCARNEQNARALLIAAFPDGQIPPVMIDVDSDPTQVAVATAMKDQLRAVGIPADVRSRSFQEFRDLLSGATGGEPGLFRSGWVTTATTPDQFLVPLFGTGLPDNLTGYTNPDLDQLFAEIRRERDPQKRIESYKIAEQKLLADAPVLPLASLQTYWVVNKAVQGLAVGPTGAFEARTVRVTR